MKYRSYLPSARLQPYIKEFIISESDEEQTYKVLPGTAIVIGFQYRGRLSYFNGKEEKKLSTYGITGLIDNYRLFHNSKDTGTVLVVFKETGAGVFLKSPLHELFGASVSLDNFFKSSLLSFIEEKLLEASSDLDRVKIVEQFLTSVMREDKLDKLVFEALKLIGEARGNVKIKELISRLNISQSPFEKRFRKIVGSSPKKFASIVRFKSIMEDYAKNNHNRLTGLAYQRGYFDQAHFIRDFKSFSGMTPGEFFG